MQFLARRGNDNNNSAQFFITYVTGQQPQGQLQTQHSVDTGNYIKDKHNIKTTTNYRRTLEEEHINTEKVNEQKQR
jgi:cyclophilin family peptidyl-prolyl cis-trans isomerase